MPDAAHDAVRPVSEAVGVAVDALGGVVGSGGIAQCNAPIGPMTTYRVGGCSDILTSWSRLPP